MLQHILEAKLKELYLLKIWQRVFLNSKIIDGDGDGEWTYRHYFEGKGILRNQQ